MDTLEALIDAVADAGGGLSSDEPALQWKIVIADHYGSKLKAEKVEVVDQQVVVTLRPDFKVELS